ncbi:hypothetical protein [Lysobacter tyrosinilyticus]
MRIRPITALALLLLLISSSASAQIYDVWEKPRNATALPLTWPTAVDIYLPQKELYAMDGSVIPMMGGVAYGIASAIANKRNERQEAVAKTLQASMPAVDYDAVLLQAFGKHIGPAQFAHIKRVTIHHETPAEVEKATPGDPDEQTLALTVRYYFATGLRDLRVVMNARLGPRRIVTAPPKQSQPPIFTQVLIYDVPDQTWTGPFATAEKRAPIWLDMGPEAISAHIRAGMDGVMAMLPVELVSTPRTGRRHGKQIGWGESPQTATFGIAEGRIGDRVLVRLRNGLLVSLPGNDYRLPEDAATLPEGMP